VARKHVERDALLEAMLELIDAKIRTQRARLGVIKAETDLLKARKQELEGGRGS
jgi:hypothetical protein